MASPTRRDSSIASAASAPRRFAWATVSDARFRRARSSSSSWASRRRRASVSRYSTSGAIAPRARIPASTTSGCSRRSRGASTVAPLALHPRQADHAVVRLDVADADAPRVAPLRGDVLGRAADQLPPGRHEEDVVAGTPRDEADHKAVPTAGLDVNDALATPPLEPVLVERRLLAIAPLGHREDRGAFLHHLGGDDGV